MKPPVAWENLYQPQSAGGLNIINTMIWNRAAIYELLCNICKRKDNPGVKWMHIYYGKVRTIWQIELKQAAWMTRKILKSNKYIYIYIIFFLYGHMVNSFINILGESCTLTELMQMDSISIQAIYRNLQGIFQEVDWTRLVCNN